MSIQTSEIFSGNSQKAWKQLQDSLWDFFSAPLPTTGVGKEIVRRDRALTEPDNLLAGSAWNLWNDFSSSVKRGSDGVVDFWNAPFPGMAAGMMGQAVLILDGLSLREAPLLMQEVEKRSFRIQRSGAWGAEIPGATAEYANALGFSQRSALANNGVKSKRLPGAWTESCGVSFHDCVGMVPPEKSIFFWHHWPDSKMHELAAPGSGLEALAKDVAEKLTSDEFWAFADRLTTGRTLLITSDHGYAATGHFPDLVDKTQTESLSSIYKAQRYAKQTESTPPLPWIPPMDWSLESPHGKYRFVLGRRKWKCPGGYPTLQHGGLSLLEMFVPFIEIQPR